MRKKWKIFFSIILAFSLFGNVFLLFDSQAKTSLKTFIWKIDHGFFRGNVKMFYHWEAFPKLKPEELATLPNDAYQWLNTPNQILIAHALGPMLYAGANTIATLEEGRRMGYKIFEVDLVLTTDKRLICYHGESFQEVEHMSHEDYLKKIAQISVSPCYFEDIVSAVKQYPEIQIVLDVKTNFNEVYDMIELALPDRSLGKRFIPQIYYFDQLKHVRNKSLFAGEIFTSYRTELSTEKILNYARNYQIKAVTLPMLRLSKISPRDLPQDLVILSNSYDDPFTADQAFKLGSKGIYTSYITPDVLKNMKISYYGRLGF